MKWHAASTRRWLALGLLGCGWMAGSVGADPAPVPPPIARELRGVWVATVANIDWPSRRGLPVAKQKAQMLELLDRAASLHLNAVFLQVRPACDAMYASRLEPWSEFLTGVMGQAPDPAYDPLEFAAHEAHLRGLELHAWFNPYRAAHSEAKSPPAADHVSRTHPELVHRYGKQLWLDPGDAAVQDLTLRVVMDVVRRYDIDGVHLDDYFYPYPLVDHGKVIPFPDDASWASYTAAGGRLARDDWRRDNVNTLIRRLGEEIHRARPWMRFGVSPFGIWRPGNPPQIRGMDPYAELYADSRRWLAEGWVDYLAPQLYWSIDRPAQSFPVLLKWWVDQNARGRHIWAGMHGGRVADGGKTPWPASEIVRQIEATRAQPGATGDILFSMAVLLANRGGLSDALRLGPYADAALPPAFPWLQEPAPASPRLTVRPDGAGIAAAWKAARTPRFWAIQTLARGTWQTRVAPGVQADAAFGPGVEAVAITAISRTGAAGAPAVWRSSMP